MEEVHKTTGSTGLLLCLRETERFGLGKKGWVGFGSCGGLGPLGG
jgi:hypothetical protein